MDVLQVIFLAGCLQAVLLAIYFVAQPTVKGSHVFATLLLLLAVHLFLVANDRQQFFMQYPHLLHITWLIPSLYGPLVLIFVRQITRHSRQATIPEVLYFIPFVALAIYHAPFFLQSAAAKRDYIADFERSVLDDFGPINQVVNWLHLIYFGAACWLYNRFHKKIVNYAAAEEARLLWLGKFLKISLFSVALGAIVFYARKYNVPYLRLIYPYHFLAVIFLIYWSAYRMIKQPAIFQSPADESDFVLEEKTPEKKLLAGQHEKLAERIRRLMEDEKLYRTPGLTLHDLSVALQSNKQYVSEAINHIYQKNFYDYVNEYRLKEFVASRELPENKNLTLLGIATNCGFNSKATFNAVFKKHFGTTPSQYSSGQAIASD